MDSSKEFQLMLNRAIESEPLGFEGFGQTKNVQDQLQEILLGDIPMRPSLIIKAVFQWCKDRDYFLYYKQSDSEVTSCPFVSMEQLWLAFVMKRRYNKVWITEKEQWVSESELPVQNVKRLE